jgi:hypothetical protein
MKGGCLVSVKKIKTVFQLRRALDEEWLLHKDVIPAADEPCFVIDKNILKIGDGETTFENLEPINGVKFEIEADGKSIVLEDNVLKLIGFEDAAVGAQPRKNADGNIEWVIPSTEDFEELDKLVCYLKHDLEDLQSSVTEIREIVIPSEDGAETLLERVENLEKETDDMVSDIKTLQDLVGDTPVNDQILAVVGESEKKANAIFEHVKYEICNTPIGTLVDYRDKEIRVMVPSNTVWTKQTVGGTGNANMHYMAFKAYAPDGAIGFKEGDRGVIIDEMFDFNGDFAGTDAFGRNYSICWLALASYNADSDTWTYFGKNSSAEKYIGWDYIVEWYNADGVVIASDCVRINLSNEDCHFVNEPYYVSKIMKDVETMVEEKVAEVESAIEVFEF